MFSRCTLYYCIDLTVYHTQFLLFPRPLSDETPTEPGEKPLFTCLALYNFDANMPGDLSLQANDKVDVFSENNGWCEGVSQRTKQRGIFPANYVQKLQADVSATHPQQNMVSN